MLHTPPILPERLPCGEVIEVDENLAEAISHRMIFTETSQHKENKVEYYVFFGQNLSCHVAAFYCCERSRWSPS